MQSQQGRSVTKQRTLRDKKYQLVYYPINKFTPFCHSPENGNLDVCFYKGTGCPTTNFGHDKPKRTGFSRIRLSQARNDRTSQNDTTQKCKELNLGHYTLTKIEFTKMIKCALRNLPKATENTLVAFNPNYKERGNAIYEEK